MSKKQMTLVYYYIPQDQDDEDTPNVFGVMVSKNNIRLQHLYDNFPLKGSYIFRFKVMYDNFAAWLDLPELDTKLPTFKDKIMVKATRISWSPNSTNPYGHYRTSKHPSPQSPPTPTQPPTTNQPQPQKQSNTDSDLLSSSNHHQPQKATTTTTIPNDFDLLNTNNIPKSSGQIYIPSDSGDLL